MKFKYIVFEGCDGTGKTSLSKEFAKLINGKEDTPVHWTFEPYGNELENTSEPRSMLRDLCLNKKFNEVVTDDSRELMMLANRSMHYNNLQKIKDNISNAIIVSDRSWISGRVYCKVASPNYNLDLWDLIFNQISEKYKLEDLVVFVKNKEQKLKEGNNDIYDGAKTEFHIKIAEAFDSIKNTLVGRNITFHNDFSKSIEENAMDLYEQIKSLS